MASLFEVSPLDPDVWRALTLRGGRNRSYVLRCGPPGRPNGVAGGVSGAPPYCTTIVTGGLVCPAVLRITGTWLPGATPVGTMALTW